MSDRSDSSTVWVFGYGSLIWRPAFEFTERRRAVVRGWARRFWQASPDHRGTPDRPGRVVTMLRWPAKYCVGRAYALPAERAPEILEELDIREVAGYERVTIPIRAQVDEEPFAEAVTWVATTSNPNFLGMASVEEMAAQVRDASGQSGANTEYVLELARALTELGAPAHDPTFALAERLEAE